MYVQYMGGVDRGDMLRELAGGFAEKSHFHKWYKKVNMIINDFMLLNASIAWRLSIQNGNNPQKNCVLKHSLFMAAYAEILISYQTEDESKMETLRLKKSTHWQRDMRKMSMVMQPSIELGTSRRTGLVILHVSSVEWNQIGDHRQT